MAALAAAASDEVSNVGMVADLALRRLAEAEAKAARGEKEIVAAVLAQMTAQGISELGERTSHLRRRELTSLLSPLITAPTTRRRPWRSAVLRSHARSQRGRHHGEGAGSLHSTRRAG